jgi:uncharacterized membrane protein YedE/YeeE
MHSLLAGIALQVCRARAGLGVVALGGVVVVGLAGCAPAAAPSATTSHASPPHAGWLKRSASARPNSPTTRLMNDWARRHERPG